MLRKELRDQDISHRSSLRKRIDEILEQHFVQLEREMEVCLFYYVRSPDHLSSQY